MKTYRTRPRFSIISVRGLALVYLLLIILTVLFSRSFISNLLEHGEIPGLVVLAVFFVIPAVMLIILLYSGMEIARDILTREPGGRFQLKLLAYFLIVVILAAAPVTLITSLSVSELLRFWRTIDVDRAMNEAQRFALESYSLNLEKLQKIADAEFGNSAPAPAILPEGIAAVQDFRTIGSAVGNSASNTAGSSAVNSTDRAGNAWTDSDYTGNDSYRLSSVPGSQTGFASRELPRDTDVIRYIMYPQPDLLRVITMEIGKDFDSAINVINNERARFNIINSIRFNISRLLVFYYGVFFLPTLLMTAIIAISFTRRVAFPIEELTEATRRVADGDFSIRILPRQGDELALLARSFNAMVADLEKSRAALLNNEKITVWQDVAQRLAHEIKNPLTPIRLSAERVLRRWQNEPERINEILENSMLAIIQEVEGLSFLLNDFRAFSRPMATSESWTGLYELVQEVIAPFSSSHPDIIFDTQYLGREINLKIEKYRLSQIFSNLIINAIDAMDSRGTVEIRTDLVKKGENIYCRLSIRDTGKGIPKEDASRVFSPYFTTKESGTGLGLPIIERIVNDHGGTIWFDSGEGAGTTFYIDLPLEKQK